MVISEAKRTEYIKRIFISRMRLLQSNGFYGLLLMHAGFALDEGIDTACTDGQKISFSPQFLDELTDGELDFVLMHEIMHMALRHCGRQEDRHPFIFNIACDIVVNSNILYSCGMDLSKITLHDYGESMHLTPDNKEGYLFTAEQVYDMLVKKSKGSGSGGLSGGSGRGANGDKSHSNGGNGKGASGSGREITEGDWDDHSRWGSEDKDLAETWNKWVADAYASAKAKNAGNLPLGVERYLKELTKAQTDWRTALQDFIQEDICDYSFSPPDRRYEGPFYLPDFNDADYKVSNVLFMVDTSGSMSKDMITKAYSEVYGAILQFNGKLQGLLGFFDAAVIEPKPFESEEELTVIKPKGGGGTSFKKVFEYIAKEMADEPPACIIILTDGYADFPPEEMANGIPVLWLLLTEDVTPPWGKVVRINGKD